MQNLEKRILNVTPDYEKEGEITWEDRDPSVADVLSAVEKKFPGVPLENLEVVAIGEDSRLLNVRKKK